MTRAESCPDSAARAFPVLDVLVMKTAGLSAELEAAENSLGCPK
jgi:hypothetical protein